MVVAADDKSDTDPDQINGSGVFDDRKCQGGCGQDHTQPQGRQQGVDQHPGHDAQHRQDTGLPALGDAAADDVHGILAGGDIEQDAGKYKQRKIVDAKHTRSLN